MSTSLAAADLLDLGVLGEAAADEHSVSFERWADLVEGFEDLHRELAGGQEDEREDGGLLAASRGDRNLFEALDHGDQKAEGLAGAGGGSGENVVAFECWRDRSGLDRRGGDEAGGEEARLEGLRDLEVVEGDGSGSFVGCNDAAGNL
jgi:hypothetical protein